MNICVYLTESLCCLPETNSVVNQYTLLVHFVVQQKLTAL